jgi:hypothetical protein
MASASTAYCSTEAAFPTIPVQLLLAALVVGAAIMAAALIVAARIAATATRQHADAESARRLGLLALFAPAVAQAAHDPRALVAWQPLADRARALFPGEFAALDRVSGGAFPFTPDAIQAAHARWSADWLAWEVAHDTEFKLKVAAAEEELAACGGLPSARARLEAVEREKLERYQKRYEEYARVSKGLKALLP